MTDDSAPQYVRTLQDGRLAVTLQDCVETPDLGQVMAALARTGNYWCFDPEIMCYVAPAPERAA